MRYNPNDLPYLREAVVHQISEDAQPFENLVEQKRKFDARDHSSRVNVTFVVDADQRSYENITRDPALKKLPGFLGLGRTIFHSRKGKAEFTFRAANNVSKVGMNEKDEGKFKKLLKKHGLKLVDTMYEGSKKLDELSRRRLTAIRISVRDTLEKANIPFDIHELKKEIRVPQKFFTKAKKELDKTFGGNLENKTGFKVVAGLVEFNDKFMKRGKYASKKDEANHAKKRKEFERELKKAGIKFHFVAGNRKGPVEDHYYVSFKNNQKAHQIANKLFAGAVFSSEIRRFGISAVSEVSFSEFSESVQLDEGSTLEFKFKNPMKAGDFMRRIMRDKLASEVDRYDGDRSPEEIVQVIMHPNDYERNDIEKLAKKYKGQLLEDLQIDEMSARDHYRRYKNKNRVTSIDRERFPNREREGLEGPYRTKKTGLIYYYDTKAKKYYDPQTDMYLSVDDIMESMGINESDHYSKKDLFTDRDIKKLSKAYGNENYKDGYRGDKQDLPGAVKDMLRYINNYSNNDLIVIALADIPYASIQAMIQLESIRGYKIKGRPPKRKSDFVKK